jgi:3',5'-cyclic AMP phosphodiesterase CpdA
MALLLHLSDLHLRRPEPSQDAVIDKLVEALGAERAAAGADATAVVVTGDLFDSATDAEGLIPLFLDLRARILAAVGSDTPFVLLPGNHDRRRFGLLGPHRAEPFHALARALAGERVFVAGNRTPYLAQVVPRELHGLAAHVVTYDSTYLPDGLFGAGGTLRLEDLLQVHAQLPDDGRPLVLLMHHHLVPTPVTDLSGVDRSHAPPVARWLLRVAVPALVANGDREELTMTALGAGTALSTLHSFRRPVLLLHGHKHVPTARLLRGIQRSSGDLLLTSAGSAVQRERVHPSRHPDAARLWPSFNALRLDGDAVRVETVSFFPKRSSRPSIRRVLAHAQRQGPKWEVLPGPSRADDPAPRVAVDDARFVLSPSASQHGARWDLVCERTVKLVPGARLRRYVDFVRSVRTSRSRSSRRASVRRVELQPDGTTSYAIQDALCRTLDEASRFYGQQAAFEWVGLLCRYGAQRAVLTLSARHMAGVQPFGSLTDLTTGRERPLAVERETTGWSAVAENCAPRSLLRLYWPLEGM